MMKPTLQLRIGQQLTMTPQLQQAIRLLQLPTIELQAQVLQALESNVMLEPEEDFEATWSSEGSAEDADRGEAAPEGGEDEPVVEIGDDWAEPSAAESEAEADTMTVCVSAPWRSSVPMICAIFAAFWPMPT